MRKIKASSGKEIKDTALNTKGQICEITYSTFINGLMSFCKGELEGLMQVHAELGNGSLRKLSIDPYAAALFFKELLLKIKAKELIYLNISCDGADVTLDILSSGIASFGDEARGKFKELASCAGFDIQFSEKIVLTTKANAVEFALVYAISAEKIAEIFDNVMFN